MIHWRQYRSLFGAPVWEGLLKGKRAYLLLPKRGGVYALHIATPPSGPTKTCRAAETGKALARRHLKTTTCI